MISAEQKCSDANVIVKQIIKCEIQLQENYKVLSKKITIKK